MNNSVELTDFHAHILPGADHGSDGAATSSLQLRMISAAGVRTIIATPHFYPNRHSVASFEKKREKCSEALARLNDGGIRVINGAEVLVCEGLEEMAGLERLCIGESRTILLEMPMTSWSDRLINTVYEISRSGLVPVMAHIDRYRENDVLQLLKTGVRAQLNASALCRRRGRKSLIGLVENGTVVAVGSDLHGAEAGSYRVFTKACEILNNSGLLEKVMGESARLTAPV